MSEFDLLKRLRETYKSNNELSWSEINVLKNRIDKIEKNVRFTEIFVEMIKLYS